MTRNLIALALLFTLAAAAHGFGLGEANRFGKLGAAGSQGSNGNPPVSACANGNLLLVYSDPCQLMSQMVGN